LAELESFLAEVLEGKQWEAEHERVLATVLFTVASAMSVAAAVFGSGPHSAVEVVVAEIPGRSGKNPLSAASTRHVARFDQRSECFPDLLVLVPVSA